MNNSLICGAMSFFAGLMQLFINLLYSLPNFGGVTPPSVQSVVGSVFGCNL